MSRPKGVHNSQTKSMHHMTRTGASHGTRHQPLVMHDAKLQVKEQGSEQRIARMSCWLSSKLKTSRLLFCRWALLDLGSGMKPCCRLHLISTYTCDPFQKSARAHFFWLSLQSTCILISTCTCNPSRNQ